MERKLLLLGMLRVDEMYGYQLNEFIDAHLGSAINLKKPTAYNLLNKMANDGWISYREEQEGNRPPRRVYTITAEGETAFQKLLRDSLAGYHRAEFRSDISLAFLDQIPPDEASVLLQNRRAKIEELLEPLRGFQDEHQGNMALLLEHQRRYLTVELDWLDEIVAHILKTQ